MTYCDQSGCAGHLGKFQNCLTEALWELSLDGGDEATGDVEFEGHLTLIVLEDEYQHRMNETRDYWGIVVTIPAGAYLVEDTNSGAIYAGRYVDEAAARIVFDAADERYGAWFGQDEEDE